MKKGFTLVEIIISIGLIVLVGSISLISFNLIKKHNKETTLKSMNPEILNALKLYIETDNEAKNRIYNNYEGMAITLETLENEGLVDFGDLDIEDDYVVAMLSNESGCSDITTVESWDLTNGPLYICSKGGSQNLFSVGGDALNYSKATRDRYYFKGGDPLNWVQLNGTGTKYRIISVEKDDSLILYHDSSFETTFNGLTNKISYSTTKDTESEFFCENNNLKIKGSYNTKNETTSETNVDVYDAMNSSDCKAVMKSSGEMLEDYNQEFGAASLLYEEIFISSWLGNGKKTCHLDKPDFDEAQTVCSYSLYASDAYKIHLKPCMKITGGTGDYATPYILKEKNC